MFITMTNDQRFSNEFFKMEAIDIYTFLNELGMTSISAGGVSKFDNRLIKQDKLNYE